MIRTRKAASLLAACVLLLGGCAARAPLMAPGGRAVELDKTPFFPQEIHQCGPAALATVLGASYVDVTPEELAEQVYIPGRRGSLQVEMMAAPRTHGRIAYRIAPDLADITAQLDSGRPVLVLHNYGLPFWPRWHYAVVVGYDTAGQQMILRSGKVQRQVLSAANFMRAWDNADRWGLVLLKPGEMPPSADRERYLEAAAGFELASTPEQAWAAFDVAVKEWPDDPVARVGRGTASYRNNDFHAAAADYRAALQMDDSQAAARNNLAMTLLQLGCIAEARRQIGGIDVTTLDAALRADIADSKRQIEAAEDTGACTTPAG